MSPGLHRKCVTSRVNTITMRIVDRQEETDPHRTDKVRSESVTRPLQVEQITIYLIDLSGPGTDKIQHTRTHKHTHTYTHSCPYWDFALTSIYCGQPYPQNL